MSKSIPLGGFNCLDAAKFNLDKYDDNSYIDCVLVILKNYTN